MPVSGSVMRDAGSIKGGTERLHVLIAMRGDVHGPYGRIWTLRDLYILGAPGLWNER